MHLLPEPIFDAERAVLAAAVRVRATRDTLAGQSAAAAELDAAVEAYERAVDDDRRDRARLNEAERAYERALAEAAR